MFGWQQKVCWQAELISEYLVRVQYSGVVCNGAIQLCNTAQVYAWVARPWSKINTHHEYTLLIHHCSPLIVHYWLESVEVWCLIYCWKWAPPQNDPIVRFSPWFWSHQNCVSKLVLCQGCFTEYCVLHFFFTPTFKFFADTVLPIQCVANVTFLWQMNILIYSVLPISHKWMSKYIQLSTFSQINVRIYLSR